MINFIHEFNIKVIIKNYKKMSYTTEATAKLEIDFSKEKQQKNNFKNEEKVSKANKCQNSVLSLFTGKNKRRNSFKTADTNIFPPMKFDYDLDEIKKFDELNQSLSDISEFDLEQSEEEKSEFNSSEEDDSFVEDQEIIIKKEKMNHKKIDFEYEIELDKELEDIMKQLKK